jgi:hypothetical protein
MEICLEGGQGSSRTVVQLPLPNNLDFVPSDYGRFGKLKSDTVRINNIL